jgi:hypothetical protein
MTDKARRMWATHSPLIIIVVGLWLCLEGVVYDKLSGIFSVGPFLAIVGGLWLVCDWFDF